MVRRKKIETDSSIKTGNDELSMVTEIETAPENLSADELEKEFPIMTLRNMVMFPSVVMPVTAGRRTTLKLVHDAMKDKKHIIIATQKAFDGRWSFFCDYSGRCWRFLRFPCCGETSLYTTEDVGSY
jgi:hypothetical protein